MKIGIGVPTFNRRDLVKLNADSLKESDASTLAQIVVIDDCSSEYDLDYLREIYPPGTEVIGRIRSTGSADLAAYDTLSTLCERDFELLICLDSDVIVSSKIVERTSRLMANTDGFCSLFNTPAHQPVAFIEGMLIKNSVGNAAVAWTKELAQKIKLNVPKGENWDWRYSDYLNEIGRRIFCVDDSLVQHLGFFQGQNALNHFIDVGAGFLDCGQNNAYRAVECLAFALQRNSRRTFELSDNVETLLAGHKEVIQKLNDLTKENADLKSEIDRLKMRMK